MSSTKVARKSNTRIDPEVVGEAVHHLLCAGERDKVREFSYYRHELRPVALMHYRKREYDLALKDYRNDSPSQARMFELGIWHPLAVPADKLDRAGYHLLNGGSWAYPSYPSGVSRNEREAALNAVRAFRDEVQDLVAALHEGEPDFLESSAALHTQLYLSPDAGARIVTAIALSAQRHGLACYDPQSDTLTLPPSLGSGKAEKTAGANEHRVTLDEPGIVTTIGPWAVRAYVEATRRCYTGIAESGSDRCGCDNCKNFAQVRDQAYPPEVLAAFDSLGIDFRKESEVHYYGRTPGGLHTYRGWFYLAGSVEQGPDSWHHPPNGKPERRFHRIGPRFEVGVGKKSDYGFSEWETVLLAAGFADGPCVEVDFYADLPWLSDAPEPDQAEHRT